jgi:hypothetical protein
VEFLSSWDGHGFRTSQPALAYSFLRITAVSGGGPIRKLYAENKGRNAVHGSDSDENADMEIAFFFAGTELVG